MTLQSSGQISASDIINEFGATRDNSSNPDRTRIGDYRRVSSSPTSGNPSFSNYPHNLGELSFPSLDGANNIPTSGTIRFSDFFSSRLNVISYGKERPVNSGSNPLAWSQNRRSVTVKAN